jgi:predicted AAA+ superfamily ATPase
MFNREIITSLRAWASAPEHKPLVLRGARQVGKTTAVQLFSAEFDHYIYLNLERPGEIDFFRKNMAVKDLFNGILLSRNIQNSGRCLLFIDEIQNSPEAIGYLRFFYEEMKELFVIAAGSLLDAMISRNHINIPVGRVEFRYLYPLSFPEYLAACRHKAALAALSQIPLPEHALPALLEEFHRYALIGGMPEIVAAYAEHREIAALQPLYQNLLVSFLDDIPKYANHQTLAQVMRHCLEMAPFEAGKRISFARFGKSEYRSREASESLRTLERAMLLYLLHPTVSTELPMLPDLRKAPRLQFLDTGLLLSATALQQEFIAIDSLFGPYRGGIAEHIVGQELIASSPDIQKKPCFWVRESPQSSAKVDFVVPWHGSIIPLEVKAGDDGRLRSLHQFIDRCPHSMAVRLYSGNVSLADAVTIEGKKFKLLNLPYVLASKIPDYLEWAFGR